MTEWSHCTECGKQSSRLNRHGECRDCRAAIRKLDEEALKDEPGGYRTIDTSNRAHDTHNFAITETIYDNLVESTTWAHCYTCKVDFIFAGQEMVS